MTVAEYNNAVKTYAAQLHGFAYRTLRDADAAKDAVQDVFERVWKKRDQIELATIKAYLYRATLNSCLDQTKKKKPTSMTGLGYDAEQTIWSGREHEAYEFGDLLESKLKLLSAQERSLIILRDQDGYSYEEIAELASLSLSQVKVYLFRARKKLKHHLSNEMIY